MLAFIIRCRTGCTCCSHENHETGPYSSREIAEERVARFTKERRLASQYARNGVYEIEEYEAEVLPDGRIIVGSYVFNGWADNESDDPIYHDYKSYK